MNHQIRAFLNRFASDRLYLQAQYLTRKSAWLNLRKPRKITEKIQWLKLYYRRPDLPKLVNKYECRPYVASRIDESHLPKLHGSYDAPEEIDWDVLPNKFVIKVSHAAAMVIICKDKSQLDQAEAIEKIKCWQSIESPCYTRFREWAYGGGSRKIIIEEFLENETGECPEDFKIFCFNGVPKFIQVDLDRFGSHNRKFYDLDWIQLPFDWKAKSEDTPYPRPRQLAKMLEIARTLSDGLPFARIDLYEILDHVYFGEITLYPGAGYGHYVPARYDEVIGEMLELPEPIR